jgi:hypothetical protein
MASSPKLPTSFTLIPVRPRGDGCSPERQFGREGHKVDEVEDPPFLFGRRELSPCANGLGRRVVLAVTANIANIRLEQASTCLFSCEGRSPDSC